MLAGRYSPLITKPPEGLGVRLVSAGPFSFLLGLLRLGVPSLLLAACVSAGSQVVRLHPDVVVHTRDRRVEVRGHVACTEGFLEQIACGRGSREHESLVVVDAPPSVVHAALLAAGFRSGRPGAWEAGPDGSVRLVPPEGESVRLSVRWRQGEDEREAPVQDWVLGLERAEAGWVFAGSRFTASADGSRYVADGSGSVIGLVTFGDEVLALRQVVPDRAAVRPPAFRARTDAIPRQGVEVTLVIKASP